MGLGVGYYQYKVKENEDEKVMYLHEELCDVLGDEAKENNQETKQSHPNEEDLWSIRRVHVASACHRI